MSDAIKKAAFQMFESPKEHSSKQYEDGAK